MFNLIRKNLRSSARSSLATFKLYGRKAGDESSNQAKKGSFMFSYLVNRCGFAPEKAISASNYINFETPDKPDSVLSFLKNHGFTGTQISTVVQRFPPVLLCDPQNTLLPKIEFFKSLGLSEEEFTHILCLSPGIFKTNLKNQLLPTVDFLKNLVSSPENIRVPLRRYPQIFFPSCRALMDENIRVLREMGVPVSRIGHYVQHQPRLFVKESDKFRKILDEVEGLGIEPSRNLFMVAVHVFCSMSKSTWEKKMGIYKKWGLSEGEILEAFRKNPWFMSCSEEKILGVMDFLVNTMGFESSALLKNPLIILFSLKKRIIPRCFVYQTLSAKGLLMKDIKLLSRMLLVSEKKFLKKFIECHEKEVPKLRGQYQWSCISTV